MNFYMVPWQPMNQEEDIKYPAQLKSEEHSFPAPEEITAPAKDNKRNIKVEEEETTANPEQPVDFIEFKRSSASLRRSNRLLVRARPSKRHSESPVPLEIPKRQLPKRVRLSTRYYQEPPTAKNSPPTVKGEEFEV